MFLGGRGTMLLPVLLALLAVWTPTEARVIQKRAAFYIANETMCIVDGDVFYNGDPVPTDDECERCTCRPPGFSCVLRDCDTKPGCKAVRRAGECCPEYVCGCVHNNRVYEDGEVIRDLQNACYTCRCHGSSISCTFAECLFRGDCPPEYVQGECCPRYDHCPPLRTTSTTAASTVFTTEASTHHHIIQQEEQFFNLTSQHLEKFTDADTTVRVEVIQPSTTRFTTLSQDTSTLPTFTVKFTLTDGPISSIADFDITTLSSVLPLQTATYTETTRYAVPDGAHGGLTTTQESSFDDHSTTESSVDVFAEKTTDDQYASSSAIEDISSESSTIDYSETSSGQPDISTEGSVNVDISSTHTTNDLPETTTAYYEPSSSSSPDASTGISFTDYQTSSSSTTSESSEITTAHYETSSSSSLEVSSDRSFTYSDAYSASTTSDISESTAKYETTSSGTPSVSTESFSIDYDASTFTAASASSGDNIVVDKVTSTTTLDDSSESSSLHSDAHTFTSAAVSSEDSVLDNKAQSSEISDVSTDSSPFDNGAFTSSAIAFSEDFSVDKEESFSNVSDIFSEESEHDVSASSVGQGSSEDTTIYYKEQSTTSSDYSESTSVVYDTSASSTPSSSSESFSADENTSSYSTTDVSFESTSIDYDSNLTSISDAFSEDTAVDKEAFLTSTRKISTGEEEHESTSIVIPTDKISVFETNADLQTEESFDVRGLSTNTFVPTTTETFINFTNTSIDVSTEYPGSSTTHATALISEDNETKVITVGTSTFSSENEYQPSIVEENIKLSSGEYNLTDDLSVLQSNKNDSDSEDSEFSLSSNVPYKEETHITETPSSSITHLNQEDNISTEHVTDESSTETVTESHSSVEDEIQTVKPIEMSTLYSTTQELGSSTDDEIINAESDQASKFEILPESITNASTASEDLSSNSTDELLESSGYNKEHYSFEIQKETFPTEQPIGITGSQAIIETSTYHEPQTTDESLFTTTETSEITTENSPMTTAENKDVSESEIDTHASIQTNGTFTGGYSEKDNIGEKTVTETIPKTTEDNRKYTIELSSVSEITETSSSKSTNVLPTTVSVEGISLEYDSSSAVVVEFTDRNETTTEHFEDATTENTQNIGVAQITNKTDVDVLTLSNNESESEKRLNTSTYFGENSSSIPSEGTNGLLDVKTPVFHEETTSTSTILQNITPELQFEDNIFNATLFNEVNAIDGGDELDSNESIVKPYKENDAILTQSTASELYTGATQTEESQFSSTYKTTTEDDLITTEHSIENGGINNMSEALMTTFANVIMEEVWNNAFQNYNLSKSTLVTHTNAPNSIEESPATETSDYENKADHEKFSTTEHSYDSSLYTTKVQTDSLEDAETSQSKLGTTVNEGLNEKTEIVLVTLHPLKTDLSGLLSVNNKQPQTTEMHRTTEETTDNNSKDVTKPFYGNEIKYESFETSISDLDETESPISHTNLEEISNNGSLIDNKLESFASENLDNTTKYESVNSSTENVSLDTHNFSFPLITSGIPGEGLFTKYAQFHDQKYTENSQLTTNIETEFTETIFEEGEQNAEETATEGKNLNGTNQLTDFSLSYDVEDAEAVTIFNNSGTEESYSVTLTENNEDIYTGTNIEYANLSTEQHLTTTNHASDNVAHEVSLLNNEQGASDSIFSQANAITINQDLAPLILGNSSLVSEERNTTHQEFDDYSALDAEEDNMNDTFVSQHVNSGSEKTFVSVEEDTTSEEGLNLSNPHTENNNLEDDEDFTKVGNNSLEEEFLSSKDTASPDKDIESVVTKENIFPDIYHVEEHAFNVEVHTTKTIESTTLESEVTENTQTTHSPTKEDNLKAELQTQDSGITASSTHSTNTQNGQETQTSTENTEDKFSSSFSQTYESTQFSTLPSQPTEDTIFNEFTENVKTYTDSPQNPTTSDSDNVAINSFDENTKLPSYLVQNYVSKTSTAIQEEVIESESNQFPELANGESLSQTETASFDSDKTTISEILKLGSTTASSDSVTEDQSISELITYNNHRGKEPELVSLQSNENHINILFTETTEHFTTSEKTQVGSELPYQTEGDEPAETHITIDQNNYGIALHEIGDPPTMKPTTITSSSAVETTKNSETYEPNDDLYENEYDHAEADSDLNSKSQTEENSPAISYEKTESPEKFAQESHTTPSQENFSVIGYLEDLFSGINVYSSSTSTDITQTESVNSSLDNHNDNTENSENSHVDPINAVESKPEQATDVSFSSSTGTNTENLVTEINDKVKTDIASSTEKELLTTEPNYNTQTIQGVIRDEIQENSHTVENGLETTENPIPKSYVPSLNFSIQEEKSNIEDYQVSSNLDANSADNDRNDERREEFLSGSINSEKPNSVSNNPVKPIESYQISNVIYTTTELPDSSEKSQEKGGEPIILSTTLLQLDAGKEENTLNTNVDDITEISNLINESNPVTTLASYVLYRGKDNDSTINITEKIVSTEPSSDNKDDINYDDTEKKPSDFISIESVSSVQGSNKSHLEVYYANDGALNNTKEYGATSSDNSSINSEVPQIHEQNITAGGIVNDTLKTQSFQPYSLFDVISNVFKAPGYDAEVHSSFLKDQADISKKEKPAGVVKRDTNQRGERQISDIYEAAISETKNFSPEPRRLQSKKIVLSEGFASSKSDPQQHQPVFASVTSSFIIVDRADDNSRSRRKIPIRNPGGEVQEIEVPASFTFPPFSRFPSRSATKNEEERRI